MPRGVWDFGIRYPVPCFSSPSPMLLKGMRSFRVAAKAVGACSVALTFWCGGGSMAAAEAAPANSTASSPNLITSVMQFWHLPEPEKQLPRPARLDFLVYYHDPFWKLLWGRNEGIDTFWSVERSSQIIPTGQRILIEGTIVSAQAQAQPMENEKITVLPGSSKVEVLSLRGDAANASRFDNRLVSLDAYVNSQIETDANHLTLELVVEGLPAVGRVLLPSNSPVPQLEGALIRAKAVYLSTRDAAGQIVQLNTWIARPGDIEVLGWIESDPHFDVPRTPVEKLSFVPAGTLVRVVGSVLTQQPGKSLTIRDETGQVTVKTAQILPLQAGEQVEAIGFPLASGLEMDLRKSLFRRVRRGETAPTNHALPKLRLAEQVKELRAIEAARGYPLRLNGVVTWSHPKAGFLFLQDVSGGIKVMLPPNSTAPGIGSHIETTGISRAGEFAPEALAAQVSEVGVMGLPETRAVTLEQAMTGIEEAKWINMSGFVRDVHHEPESSRLDLMTSAGEFTAVLPRSTESEKLRGAVVRLSGVCRAITNAQHQLTGIQLWVPTEQYVEVQESLPADPFSAPLRTIASLREFSTLNAAGRRVQITGVVLEHTLGRHLRIENNGDSLLVFSRDLSPLAIGDRVKVVGFPGRQSSRVVLREAVYQRVATGRQPVPTKVREPKTVDPELDGQLVDIEGTLLETSNQPEGARLTVRAGSIGFEALLDLSASPALPDHWVRGSLVALTGVYEIQFDEYLRPHGFVLRLRTPADVLVLSQPSWWTAQRAWAAAGLLAIAGIAGLGWAVSLRRQVRQQTDEIRAQWEKSARLENELTRASKLESLGLLAGGIAHDFNNLLMVMMGNITLVLHDRDLDDDKRAYLSEVEKATLRGRDLTQQLLTFAKGGAPMRTSVNLARIVRDAAGFAVLDSHVRCEFDFSDDLWPANADKGQMAQVMHNVILNAVQAMPNGGLVKIGIRNTEVGSDEVPTLDAGRYLKMSVTDQGTGISPDHLARIFDPYFTTKQHGSGLGLATVYSIVKRHQGYLSVSSTLGLGTTFDFWLPAAAQHVETRAPMPLAPRRRGRVLFMDDEPFIRNIAVTLLRRINCDPTVVNDGMAAVRAFFSAREAGAPYDVVILDLTVPAGMGGAEAMKRLLEIDPNVKAIVSSAYSSDPVMANFREHGFKAAVPKPYEVKELMSAVEILLHEDPSVV
jgi:two-component system, cell cycle sensor histidine kinase and response regulator CckA